MNTIMLSVLIYCMGLFTVSYSPKDTGITIMKTSSVDEGRIYLADPTIFHYKGIYYLYGTYMSDKGFVVYTSTDLKDWKGPAGAYNGFALRKGDAYGTGGFWAPQVFEYNNKFYMAYTANEHIAIAESDNPLGPFTQKIKQPIIVKSKTIDPFVFMDDNGKKYLYHVRLQGGNRIFVAELKNDFTAIKPHTLKSCINAVDDPQSWENTDAEPWTVTEGPTVLKHKDHYYLFYSGNGYTNIHYAVGYATSKSPTGPWKKYDKNPILNKDMVGENGTGHGDFFKSTNGQYYYVFHTHHSDTQVSPRETAIIKGAFIPDNDNIDKMKFDQSSFHYLSGK